MLERNEILDGSCLPLVLGFFLLGTLARSGGRWVVTP